jgi:hypothetical protein
MASLWLQQNFHHCLLELLAKQKCLIDFRLSRIGLKFGQKSNLAFIRKGEMNKNLVNCPLRVISCLHENLTLEIMVPSPIGGMAEFRGK